MLEFLGLGSQGAHDFCESNCPEFVYDYLKGQGLWDHLFRGGVTDQIIELMRENPYSAAALLAVGFGGLTAGAVKVIRGRNGKEEIVVPEGFEITRVDAPAHEETDSKKALILSSSDEHERRDAVVVVEERKIEAAPVKIPASLLLQKVFNFLKENRSEPSANIAAQLGIEQANVEAFRQLPGFPAAPTIFAQTVRNGRLQGRALELLGLPADGSYPTTVEQNDHYQRLCEAVKMPSQKDDLGERRAIVGGGSSKLF